MSMTSLLVVFAAMSADAQPLVLNGSVTVECDVDLPGVQAAVADLGRDLEWVLGDPSRITAEAKGQIVIRHDPSLGKRESWRIEVTPQCVGIRGADELGVIYGVYEFSRRILGVDPYWYWKDLIPERRQRLTLRPLTIESQPATFRFRGWFINDEDLLTEWKDGGGIRHVSYPFYHQVVHLEILERVFETLLRAGGNLIIPASFVDVMNPPEAQLVRRAAERGLYVTQHHIEPLGVSHYGFENYWKTRGKQYAFAYGKEPERVREVWLAFAKRWVELAGDNVVWQLGLRGKGDTAIWRSDKTVSEVEAGRFISRAIAEQWSIVREVDPRPNPPATATLWMEGSQLMSQGALQFPKGVTIVFADRGYSQTMQRDFHKADRVADHTYGVYHHVGFWSLGPHLIQSTRPAKVKRVLDGVVAKGDVQYAIINVCNLREHVLGVQAATEIMCDQPGWSEAAFWQRFAPAALHSSYHELIGALVEIREDELIQDGTAFVIGKSVMDSISAGKPVPDRLDLVTKLGGSIDKLIAEYPTDRISAADRPFFDVNLLMQAKMLRNVYAWLQAVIIAGKRRDASQLETATAALQQLLDDRKQAEQGKWSGWYRGDKKVNVQRWIDRILEAKKNLQG